MVEVNLWSGLRRFTDGEVVVSVEAATVGEMLDALVKTYPGLGPVIEEGVAIAIDGEIFNGGRQKPVSSDNEIFLLQRLKGG